MEHFPREVFFIILFNEHLNEEIISTVSDCLHLGEAHGSTSTVHVAVFCCCFVHCGSANSQTHNFSRPVHSECIFHLKSCFNVIFSTNFSNIIVVMLSMLTRLIETLCRKCTCIFNSPFLILNFVSSFRQLENFNPRKTNSTPNI